MKAIFAEIGLVLNQTDVLLKQGTFVDATIISAQTAKKTGAARAIRQTRRATSGSSA